ncbi:Vms1/Ankzf1 family peptidyl-tRNA hydrolase [Streptomyces sp. NPDC096152]|uniref:baeRF2 domain-containing protein n=1 Tax=Streptomyces sp. NPDC096152 TaxID=3366078 RepID=UPI0037FA85C8
MRLSFLQQLFDRDGPWATVYFHAAHEDEAGAKRHELSVGEACRTLEEEGADAATVRAVRETLMEASPAEDPAGRVYFATDGEVVLSHALSRPPERPISVWAPLPRLTPLLELSGRDPLCLVAYIDRTGADFELRSEAVSHHAGQVAGRRHPVHRTASDQLSERHFQLKVENTWQHNAGAVAEALASACEESGADLVVLVGDARERRAVHEKLPDPVRRVAVETAHGGRAPGSSSAALEEDIAEARQQYVHRRAQEALDRFRTGRSGGQSPVGAVEGVPALVEAAREHRIDTLLIRPDGPDLASETWIGGRPDQLAVRRTNARTLGESDPWPARADDALLRSAATTGADVMVVAPDEADDHHLPTGGLGALLRWTYEPSAV